MTKWKFKGGVIPIPEGTKEIAIDDLYSLCLIAHRRLIVNGADIDHARHQGYGLYEGDDE